MPDDSAAVMRDLRAYGDEEMRRPCGAGAPAQSGTRDSKPPLTSPAE